MLGRVLIKQARVTNRGLSARSISFALNQEHVVFHPNTAQPAFTLGNGSFSPVDLSRTISGLGDGMVTTLWENIQSGILFLKRTFQPSLIRRKRKHGFLARQATKDGRAILQNRRSKGRRNLCA
mmetsp:Transcript_117255/g.230005  ORF Transcript_117255/g.230005 Transcript_117255/m.230005 type:complete len:124 (-) Transcript_117255:45-416(-)